MSRTIYSPANFNSLFRTKETAIYQYVDTNPGSTVTECATALAEPEITIEIVDTTLQFAGLVTIRYDFAGTARLYTALDWAQAMLDNRTAARTWLDANNNGGDETALATALNYWSGLADEALARAFFDWFRDEESGRPVHPQVTVV
jgi:hypothetical protein